ncbi:MAG: hypothetical protein WD770_08165 [Actinomycetota bacterium]
MRHRWTRIIGIGVAFALLGAACNSAPGSSDGGTPTTMPGHDMGAATSATAASELRSNLNLLLQEHVYLAAIATNEALAGRTDGFTAAAGVLDANSDDLIETFGSVYPDAEATFSDAWKGHIGFFVDYTTGLAEEDQAKADKAIADLQGYADSFGQFLSDTVEGLPDGEAVSGLILEHALTLKAVVDAQAAGQAGPAFAALREAAGHMHMLADPLAAAIAGDNGLEGDANAPAAGLRSDLNRLLQEHVYLAGIAAEEALAGRQPVFEAAAAALDGNSDDVIATFGSVYPDAEATFSDGWKGHIGFVVDYVTGVATSDQDVMDRAVADLLGYVDSFGQFLSDTIPTLPGGEAVSGLIEEHVLTLKATIDAVADADPEVFTKLRTAAGHMHMLGDPLTESIVQDNPEAFAA